jgi:hypothetical protein
MIKNATTPAEMTVVELALPIMLRLFSNKHAFRRPGGQVLPAENAVEAARGLVGNLCPSIVHQTARARENSVPTAPVIPLAHYLDTDSSKRFPPATG